MTTSYYINDILISPTVNPVVNIQWENLTNSTAEMLISGVFVEAITSVAIIGEDIIFTVSTSTESVQITGTVYAIINRTGSSKLALNNITISATSDALGSIVIGPETSVIGNIPIFSNVTGNALDDSGYSLSNFALASEGVTNGDSHNHVGGDGASLSHTNLTDIGNNLHTTIDSFISSKAQASGLASLNSSSKVVQDPANATSTPTQNKIPIADGLAGTLATGWIPDLSGTYAPTAKGVTNGDSHNHNGGDGAQIDHGGLGGLGDDDHAGYLLLAGRGSSGQTIIDPITTQDTFISHQHSVSTSGEQWIKLCSMMWYSSVTIKLCAIGNELSALGTIEVTCGMPTMYPCILANIDQFHLPIIEFQCRGDGEWDHPLILYAHVKDYGVGITLHWSIVDGVNQIIVYNTVQTSPDGIFVCGQLYDENMGCIALGNDAFMIVNDRAKFGRATTSGHRLNLPNSATPAIGQAIANAWTTYSSRRWKQNIITISNALEKIKLLSGVEFNWKPENGGKHDIGLIAEDVGQVIPEVVTYEDNGIDAQSVKYDHLVALLIEGIKEQQMQIDELKSEIKILKGDN